MRYVVDLEVFHGPLDLLLYLIEKNEIDIYDIPVAKISDQYIEYLQKEDRIEIDKLGDFLVMASYLLNLKSRMLLPKSVFTEDENEEETDPRSDLVKSLLDYRRFKKAALLLEARQEEGVSRIFFRESSEEIPTLEQINVDVKALINAYRSVIKRMQPVKDEYEVPAGDVNVAEKMDEILNKVSRKDYIFFQDLFVHIKWRREALALFLALLELIRLGKVMACQEAPEMPIKIFLRVEDGCDDARSD